MTEWRDIPGYEGRYQISDDGRIMTFPDAWGVYQDGNVNTAIYAGKRKCITCSRERARNRYRRIADHRSPA